MVNLFRHKKIIIIVSLLIIACMGSIGFVIFSNVDQKNDTTTSKSRNTDSTKPTPAPKNITPPKSSLPETCKKYSGVANQVTNAELQQTGTVVKTANSHLTQCNYYKEETVVNIKIYEYSSDVDAKADLQKIQVGGYTTENKGKHSASVSVVGSSGVDANGANSILVAVLRDL